MLLKSSPYSEGDKVYPNDVKIHKTGKYKERIEEKEVASEGKKVKYGISRGMSGDLKDEVSIITITY